MLCEIDALKKKKNVVEIDALKNIYIKKSENKIERYSIAGEVPPPDRHDNQDDAAQENETDSETV